jgi:hypothetical protein
LEEVAVDRGREGVLDCPCLGDREFGQLYAPWCSSAPLVNVSIPIVSIRVVFET